MASVIQNSELARKHISVIHYAVDSSLFFPEMPASIDVKLDIPNWKKIILFCGGKRLAGELPAWRKGWQYLVDALTILAENFSDMHLLYVGDTIELPTDFPVSVTFAEGVAHEDMRDYYAIADIFVLPTLGDNSPLTILEAMACKTPVVATEVGGIPESIVSGETGLLSPPRNAITLAESIGFLLTHPNQALSMAALGYQRIVNNFNFDEMIGRYETLYLDTIAGGHNYQNSSLKDY
jgi:glycosyltransferase involved in cell wall biosynthesis